MVLLVATVASNASAASIEAVKGKSYPLTKKHGPWMIMVTSLWGETPDQEEHAVKAANELVYQLRKKGIPAYLYKQNDEYEEFDTFDRMGRERRRKYTAQNGMIGVLAGNYPSYEDKTAQQTLKFIKKFQPKVTVQKNGKTVDVPLVLNKAFITRNPVLTPEEMASKKTRDPLLVRLNSGIDHSLLENKGKYTLIVSSFYGNSAVKPAEFRKFDSRMDERRNISLDNAAEESWQLVKAMRAQGIEAYLYHERFRSIVTVGAFRSKDDPEIVKLTQMFQAKYKKDEKTGKDILLAESIQMKGKNDKAPPIRAWTMDPVPQLMEVPR